VFNAQAAGPRNKPHSNPLQRRGGIKNNFSISLNFSVMSQKHIADITLCSYRIFYFDLMLISALIGVSKA